MRKLTFLLLFAISLPLISCGNKIESPQMEENKTETLENDEGPKAEYPLVVNKLSTDAIESFPVANADMTADELYREGYGDLVISLNDEKAICACIS